MSAIGLGINPLWVAKETSLVASVVVLMLVYFAGYFGMGLVWVFILLFMWVFADARNEEMRKRHLQVSMAKTFHHPQLLSEVINGIPHWVRFPDFESVNWINKIVKILWPFVKEATEKTVREALDPIFEESKPPFLTRLGFATLTLGNDPPTFTGMKCYEGSNEVMLDLQMRMALPESNIVIAAGTQAVALKVGVRELQVFGTFRVVLARLHGDFPCFKMIATAFAEPPTIDFKLEMMGGNFMAIPGLSGWIQSFLKETLVQTYVWPKVVVTPMVLMSDGPWAWPGPKPPERLFMTAKQAEKMVADLYKEIDKPAGVFKVDLIAGVDLMKKDKFGKSDPFVKFALGLSKDNHKRSRVIQNNLNPDWGQSFEFRVQDPTREALQVQVMDENVGRDEPLGDVKLHLRFFEPFKERSLEIPLNNAKTGRIQIRAVYMPFEDEDENIGEDEGDEDGKEQEEDGEPKVKAKQVVPYVKSYERGMLTVDCARANDLIAADAGGTSDPYCKLMLGNKVHQTKKVKKTLNPVWNDTVNFDVNEAELEELIVEVYDYDKLSGHDLLGSVRIPVADVLASKGSLSRDFALEGVESGTVNLGLTFQGQKYDPATGTKLREVDMSRAPEIQSSKSMLGGISKLGGKITKLGGSGSTPAVVSAGTLVVRVVKGTDLMAMDNGKSSDPFVKLKIGKEKHKTKVIKKNLNPVWNEEFKFAVADPLSDKLEVHMFDKDRLGSSDPMGDLLIPVADVVSAGNTLERAFTLQGADRGSLTLALTFQESAPKDKKK